MSMTERNHQKLEPSHVIGLSILAGAILISASIFYNTNSMVSKLGGTGGAVAAAGAKQAPSAPVKVNERSDAPVLGKKDAKVTIIEFSDFQCPYCKKFNDNTFAQIKKEYVDTGKAKIVFRHFPLSFHVNAEIAGEAAECANRQGKFWDYHDLLFKNGQADGAGLDSASLKKYAEQVGLNTAKFNSCLDNGETAEIVKKDFADGQAAGTTGTPSFYVNGVQVVGALPFASFSASIENALK